MSGRTRASLWWLRQQPAVRRMGGNLVPKFVPESAKLTLAGAAQPSQTWLT
jgi:hypothetical protein